MNRADLAKRRILVVEDEAIIAMLIEDIIEDLGCAVVGPVAQVEAALTVIDTDEIDGAVLDVNLDGEPSYRVADALAARGRPFIFVTGYGETGLDPAYRGYPVVQKPFSRENLEQALDAYISR